MPKCSELADNLTKIAMNLAARENIRNLDDVVLAMKQYVPLVTRDIVVDAIVEASTTESRKVDAITQKLRDIRQEARTDKNLNNKIKELETYLEEGELPEPQKRTLKSTDATKELRSILNDLRSQLNRSEPAVRKRLEKSIADLEAKLKSGDILPKIRPPKAESEEIDQLIYKRDLIKREIQDELRSLRPMTWWGRIGAGWDIVRLMMTTGEFSFALRQGGVYAMTHPIKWSGALVNAFKGFGSAKGLYDVNKGIFHRKNAHLYNSSGLTLLHEGMSLTRSEEVIMNYWMDKLPVMKNFNRAAIGFFNTMRADMFDMGYQTLSKNGKMTQEEMEIWSNYINVMSGRGKLSVGSLNLETAALPLNRAFFSVRYVASRFQMLTGQPLWHKAGKGSLRIRKQIAKEYIRLGIGLATIYSLGMLTGADIEDDPTSSDFGKLRYGNRRLDVMMGFSQVSAFMSRLITGKYKTQAGDILALRGPDKKYGGPDILSVMSRFMRSKLSPQFGVAMNLLTGETYLGDEVSLLNTLPQLGYPIAYGDIYDVMKEEGMETNMILTVLMLLGMGLQTYEPRGRGQKKELSKKEIKELLERN